MRGRKMKQIDMARVMELNAEGKNIVQIASELGVAYGTLASALKREGVELKKWKKSEKLMGGLIEVSEFDRVVIESYQSGMTLRQAGAVHGVSGERVRQILVKNGEEKRNKRESSLPLERVIEKVGEGLSREELARFFGVSIQVLSLFLRDNEIEVERANKSALWERIEEIKEDYRAGMPMWDMAEKYGQTSYGGIARLMDLEGEPRRGVLIKDSELPVEEIREKYAAGATLASLAREYGVCIPTLRKRLPDDEVRSRRKEVLTSEEVRRRHEGGESITAIARACGVSRDLIKNRLRCGN